MGHFPVFVFPLACGNGWLRCENENYRIIGVAVAVLAAVALLPDFVRYMKIRAM
jgi:hypothetical protein